MDQDPKTLNEAFRLKAAGLRPIPLNGKLPPLKNWECRSLDTSELRDWWRMVPRANVGLVMGRDPANPDAPAVVCVDVDPRNGGHLWEADHLIELRQAGPAIARTGGGGHHYFFRHPGGWVVSGTNKVAKGVDMKADGGHQVVVSPSIHPETGAAYVWETEFTAADVDMLGVLPEWIAVAMAEAPPRATGKNRGEAFADLPADVLACRDRMRAFPKAVEGQAGDATTFRAACLGRDHDLSPEVFWPMLQEWNETCEPPWHEDQLRTKLERAYLYAKADKGDKGVSGLPASPIVKGSDEDPDRGPIRRGRPPKTGDAQVQAEAAGKAIAEEAEDEALAYLSDIRKTKDGHWRDHTSSADIMLRRDPRLAQLFRRNQLTGEVELHGRVPWRTTVGTPGLNDRDLEGIATWVATAALPADLGGLLSEPTWFRGINLAAERNAYHPVRDWLDTLTWDGVARLDQAAMNYYGAPEPIAAVFLAKWMVAAVARVRNPGDTAKMDAALVLEGDQGLGKTTSLARLFGDSWYAELRGVDPEDKDTPLKLRGIWCAEFSEMAGFGRKEQGLWKSFISATEDRQRDPYARTVTLWPRQCVLAATTNGAGYLTDETGNRRWWPILCRKADYEAISRDRAQLWAEAHARWSKGRTWQDPACAWRLTPGEITLATEAQTARHAGDALDEHFAKWAEGKTWFTFADWWQGSLMRDLGLARRPDEVRLAALARRAGWRQAVRKIDKRNTRGYARDATDPATLGGIDVSSVNGVDATEPEPGSGIGSDANLDGAWF